MTMTFVHVAGSNFLNLHCMDEDFKMYHAKRPLNGDADFLSVRSKGKTYLTRITEAIAIEKF